MVLRELFRISPRICPGLADGTPDIVLNPLGSLHERTSVVSVRVSVLGSRKFGIRFNVTLSMKMVSHRGRRRPRKIRTSARDQPQVAILTQTLPGKPRCFDGRTGVVLIDR